MTAPKSRTSRRRGHEVGIHDLDAAELRSLRLCQWLAHLERPTVDCATRLCSAAAITHEACTYCERGKGKNLPADVAARLAPTNRWKPARGKSSAG